MTEYEQAKQWREARQLTVPQLSALSGYSVEAIYLFERGKPGTKGHKRIPEWVWQRYKMACAGIDAQIESGRNFTWGK